ncbi:MAG: MgtC/SapB family protein [Clostridia bacterium]|nr:MgtC/SapB family protein [Clostridia bacterium]
MWRLLPDNLIELEYFLRMLIAIVLGFAIGLERKIRFKEAGMRTHTIVAAGACLFMIISKYGFDDIDKNFDVARVAAQVVSGVGFLGAGMIMYRKQAVHSGWLNSAQKEVAEITNLKRMKGTLADAVKGADVFIGVSGPHCVTKDMVKSMAAKPVLFTCANPVPEIDPADAKEAGAFIVGTGSSENPNQINNVLVFPGLFRGALDVRATTVNTEMMIAAAHGIAGCVSEKELSVDYILPYAFDKKAHDAVAKAVAEAAVKTGVSKQF